MNNCTYCQEIRNGQVNKILMESSVKANGIFIIGAGVWIDNDEMELYFNNQDMDIYSSVKMKIKYCPLCGRELKKDEG